MAIVKFNGNTTKSGLIENIKDSISKLKTAQNMANSIVAPEGINWSSVTGSIDSCMSNSLEYSRWINKCKSDYEQEFIESVSEIRNVEFNEIKNR